jgi:N-ethylmaleimide reductase
MTRIATPSVIKRSVTPHELTIDEISETVEDFKNAGRNAMKAGFDGVEIHSSNGYLFHQFFNNSSNTRNDEYGGSDENKTRFLFEVIDALKEVIPENRIALRLNPMMTGKSGIDVDDKTAGTFEYIIKKLNDYDLAYLHLSRQWRDFDEPYFIKDVIGHFRKIYNGFLVANQGYEYASAEKEITENRTDAVAFGRYFISNPDLPERFTNSWPLAEYDTSTFYSDGKEGYTDYPKFKN